MQIKTVINSFMLNSCTWTIYSDRVRIAVDHGSEAASMILKTIF